MATPEDIAAANQEEMVIIGNVRYQRRDAERFGLLKAEDTPEPPAKRRSPAKNKARTPEDTK